MKVTAFAALCAAPLALAGALDMDLRQRGLEARNDILLGSEVTTSEIGGKKNSDNKGQKSNDNKNNNNNNNGQISSISQSSTTEIIIIWVNPGNNAATTTVNSALASATQAGAAATQTVTVGGSQKVYTPDSVTANVGDVIIFEFQAQNHTATQSSFGTPCIALPGGMDSGFMPNANGTVSPPPQVAMTVNVTTPIWFYCRQKGHCGEGMTFSINPTTNKTQADFQAAAIAQNGTGAASGITGGAASSVVAVPPAASTSVAAAAATSAASSSSGLTSGTGTINADGSCSCAVVCAAGSIPNPAAQGVNAFGGMLRRTI